MAIQKLISGGKVTKIRVTVPNYINQMTYPINLGMPALPLTTGKPLIAGGGTDAITPSLNGISKRSIKVSTKPARTKSPDGGGKGISFGSDVSSGTVRKRKTKTKLFGNSSKRGNSGSKRKIGKAPATGIRKIRLKNGRIILMKNGKFIKGGS